MCREFFPYSYSLFNAVSRGYLGIVQLLLEAGEAVNQTNADGAAPLFIAAQAEHHEMVKLLLKMGRMLIKLVWMAQFP